jgi:hypothetical protein
VACYYGWDAAYLTRMLKQVVELRQRDAADNGTELDSDAELRDPGSIPPGLLQNRVLAHMGKGGHATYSRCERVCDFAARIIARNLQAGSSDVCAICLDPCQNGTLLWTCSTCQNHLHGSCFRDWCRRRRRGADAEPPIAQPDHGGGGQQAPCPYCRAE